MRLAAFFGVVLATSLAIVGAAVLVVLTTPDPDPLWAGLSTAAAGVFLCGIWWLSAKRPAVASGTSSSPCASLHG